MQSLNFERLQESIEIWMQTFPKEAILLHGVEDSRLQFVHADDGSLNMMRKTKEKEFFFHDQQSPINEAKEWASSLKLTNETVVYIYGIGLGYYYEALHDWLRQDPERAIVFMEDDLSVLKMAFSTAEVQKILKDDQVRVIYFDNLADADEAFDPLYWDFVMTQMNVSALQSYAKEKHEQFIELKQKVVYDASIRNGLVEEYLKHGISFFRNYYQNLLLVSESWKGDELFGKFHGIPAIICGAGPSLDKNVEVVRTLLDRALVFGGGSAMNALSSRGILPHFGIGIDPNPTQQFRLSTNKAYEVPLFYRNRMHHEAFKLVHGPRLYIYGAGGYDIADWFDERFGLHGEWIDEGHNVVNFGIELAIRMGCNPIILTGVDLAYTGMLAYAKGVVDEMTVHEEVLKTDDFDTTAMLKKDIYGEPIYTLWKWIAESNWIGDFAKEHRSTEIVNCTEGGLGMPGVRNMTLLDAKERYMKRRFDLKGWVRGEILSSAMPGLTQDLVFEEMESFKESLIRSRDHLDVLIEDSAELKKKVENEGKIPQILQSGLAALSELELSEEPGYEYLLDLFNNIYSRVLNKELHRIRADSEDPCRMAILKCTLNIKRLQFLKEVAEVNIQIIDFAVQERKKSLTQG